VVEALAKRMADIPIEIVPYQRNAAPARIELESTSRDAAAKAEAPQGGR
jgi:hypothetical protein